MDLELALLDVVLMGRTPYKRPVDRDSAEDLCLAYDSLARVDAAHLVNESVTTLCGGERHG